MMRNLSILLLIIFVVALSGCTATDFFGGQSTPVCGGVGPGTNGVVISQFSSDVSTLETGEMVVFNLVVQNKGAETATNIGSILFGLNPPDWEKPSRIIELPTTLSGADTGRGFAGEQSIEQWQSTAQTDKPVDTSYVSGVRVYYTYSTTSSSLLKIATSDYIRSVGGSTKGFGLVDSQTTSGSLTITVKMAASAIVSSGTTTRRVQFEIVNNAGGRVFGGDPKPIPAVRDLDMLEVEEISGVSNCPDRVKLVNGKAIINCDVEIGELPEGFGQFPIELKFNYNYFVDSCLTIKLLRRL